MSSRLKDLVKKARRIQMTDDQKEQQRRSFAYGNAGLENDLITREMVDKEAEKLAKTDG